VLAFGLHAERDRSAYQRRVAFLSAGNTGLYARLTVRMQIDTWARIAFVGRERRPDEVERVIREFNLEEIAEARSDRISMGQRQRLRLAMTFVGGPGLVLLDEPATSLDAEGYALMVSAIHATAARGGAMLWVSPSGDEPRMDFTERHLLEDGRLRRI
jgi:ABC-type multidrug transport system ATPase subunit